MSDWVRRPGGRWLTGIAGLAMLVAPATGFAYPIDAYERTGIGRLEVATRIEQGRLDGTRQPAGALLDSEAVDIRLAGGPRLVLPEPNGAFTAEIRALLGEYADRYSIAVLDMTHADDIVYAEHDGDRPRNPGSVGKILVALALYQQLADLYPNDIDRRWAVLRDTQLIADDYIVSDHHTVRMWDRANETLIRRPLEIGDRGSLMEFIDWMMSPSSNAAAAVLMKEAVLMQHFGTGYPTDSKTANAWLEASTKADLRDALARVMHDPVTRNGLDIDRLRQGSLFTRTGKKRIPGATSYATARELMRLMLAMEQGRLVDRFSSREIKRMLYVTERRIRYASSPALRDHAVYFKSGSLYQCQPEPGFECRKYHGNVKNHMNSIAIIEAPAREPRIHYAVALMSNVLRRNSAVDHQSLATRIHDLMLTRHGLKDTGPVLTPPRPEIEPGEGVSP